MNRNRLIVLTALLIIALFAAVLPAVAADNFTIFNLSFAGDKNGDNIPDKWNVKGDVYRTCNLPPIAVTYDACTMVFPPSSKGATLWQRLEDPAGWVVLDEAVSEWLGHGDFGAKNMEAGRAVYGNRIIYYDGSKIVVYSYIPGGTYNFQINGHFEFYGAFNTDIYQDIADGLVQYVDHGIVTLPHDGILAVNWMANGLLD